MTYSLVIDGWKRNIRFSAAHVLPGHEKCSRLHGHIYALNLNLEAENLPSSGMIMDFSVLTQALHNLTEKLDHKMLIPEKHPGVTINKKSVIMDLDEKHYQLPKEDCEMLPLETITAEQLAQYCLDELQKLIDIPNHITKITIGIDEGYGTQAQATINRG